MKVQDGLNYPKREQKTGHYDKRFIRKIVAEIENGLPRKQAIADYGLSSNTLYSWMQAYGSSDYHQNQKRRCYTLSEKRTIVRSILQGTLSIKEARIAYNVKNEKSIRAWISKFKKENSDICSVTTTAMEIKKGKEDIEQIALKKALSEAELRIQALNTLIDIAEQKLKITIRKKSGTKQSGK